jgi:N utilization substance protein B
MNRKTARENAFILLFELSCKNDETAEEIFDKATNVRELECDSYVKQVFFGVNENIKIINECIDKCIVGWKSARLSIVSQAILRLAVYELMFIEDIPAKVSINEGIELSKKYDDDKAFMLINGALNAAAELLNRK